MSFTFPLALFGLLTLPALVAIYWLRNRSRTRVVSSLMLWMDQRQLKEGGLLIHRLQTPLLFFLELLSILLIVTAASGPMVRAGQGAGPLSIVLDNSFSMLAGGQDSARTKAAEVVKKELNSANGPVKFVLADEKPQLLGESAEPNQAGALLEQWKCYSPSSNLGEAISFAFAIGGDRSRVLVLTDHAPPTETETPRLEWRAFGHRRPNIAFVNATRTTRDNDERCMLEIANLSDRPAKTELLLESNTKSRDEFQELRRSQLELPANATQRVVLTLSPDAEMLRARIGADSLAIDNEVIMLPGREPPAHIKIEIANGALREIVENAIRATTKAETVDSKADLVITDEPEGDTNHESWVCRIVPDANAESYVGPFVIDRNHPLCEGLSLDGVIWGAGKAIRNGGLPIITAGNIPLVSDLAQADGAHEVRLSFRPDLSTLQRSPAWPILIWNLLAWRASELPGVHQANVRLGSDARITLPVGVTAIDVVAPSGVSREIAALNHAVSFRPEAPGVYRVVAGNNRYSFGSNALRKEESDLSLSDSGVWGSLNGPANVESELHNIAWLFLLLAMMVLSAHLALISRDAKQRVSVT
jgi:aerotolerance regulator-like protein